MLERNNLVCKLPVKYVLRGGERKNMFYPARIILYLDHQAQMHPDIILMLAHSGCVVYVTFFRNSSDIISKSRTGLTSSSTCITSSSSNAPGKFQFEQNFDFFFQAGFYFQCRSSLAFCRHNSNDEPVLECL